jgi:uncharacterized lipoprotein YmbA
MIRLPLMLAAAALALAGCALGGPQGGYANYDALAQMQQDCAAKGGNLKLKPQANPEWIDGYVCERK